MSPDAPSVAGPSTSPDRPVDVILALGSNVGDRRLHLERGVEFLSRRLRLVAASRLVESVPWGPIVDQPDFLNLLLRGRTTAAPLDLLEILREAELAAGRVRVVPQGPRTLDVDLIFYDAVVLAHPELQIPHPRWRERPFVADLVADVAGGMVDPDSGRPLEELVPAGRLSQGLRQVPGLALPPSIDPPAPGAVPEPTDAGSNRADPTSAHLSGGGDPA